MPQVTSRDGTVIGYDMVGTGPALIIVSGATQYRAVDQNITPALVHQLAQKFSVITYDRRGRGESGDTAPYAVRREVEDIAALIEMAGGTANIFGVSSGAVLALEAAAAMPRKIHSAVLYEPPIDPGVSSETYRFEYTKMAALAAQGRSGEMMSLFLSGIGMPAATLDEFQQSTGWKAFSAVGITIAHDYRILAEARAGDLPPEHWQNAIMPVLVVDGDQSFPFMAAGADWIASGLHNAQRVTLADQGHNYDPAVLAPLLSIFFERGTVQVH